MIKNVEYTEHKRVCKDILRSSEFSITRCASLNNFLSVAWYSKLKLKTHGGEDARCISISQCLYKTVNASSSAFSVERNENSGVHLKNMKGTLGNRMLSPSD